MTDSVDYDVQANPMADSTAKKRRTGALSRAVTRVSEGSVLAYLRKNMTQGALTLTLPGGAAHRVDSGVAGPDAEVIFHDWRAIRRLFAEGGVGFADGYIEAEWDTPDLASLIELAARNKLGNAKEVQGGFWARQGQRLFHALRGNSKEGSRKNIAYHYDLGNDFYKLWLDDSMTYSSAVWGDTAELRDAQHQKYRRLLELMTPKPGQRVLEIGCGWGGFAEMAAKDYGLEVDCLTLSQSQHAWATDRMARHGLSNQVNILMQDYRDTEGQYDHIASIEMFEAVGESYWPSYFQTLHDCLKPGGTAALQVITINDAGFEQYRNNPDFIQTHIFPGGMLPSVSIFKDHCTKAGLAIKQMDFFGLDYARTLREWRDRFDGAWDDIRQMGFDDQFRRLWRYYLAYCEGGFRAGSINVMQVALGR